MFEESSERLSGRSFELDVDGVVGQSLQPIFLSHSSGEHGTHGAVCVLDSEVEVHLLLIENRILCSADDLLVKHSATHSERNRRSLCVASETKFPFLLISQS